MQTKVDNSRPASSYASDRPLAGSFEAIILPGNGGTG
jgi:hypothetical protein